MRFAFFTLLSYGSCAVTVLATEDPGKWKEGKGLHGAGPYGNVNKTYGGGVGGGIKAGDIGVIGHVGSDCDPAACDTKVRDL